MLSKVEAEADWWGRTNLLTQIFDKIPIFADFSMVFGYSKLDSAYIFVFSIKYIGLIFQELTRLCLLKILK